MITFPGKNTRPTYLIRHFCNAEEGIQNYVRNLTSSYIDTRNESSMVSASVIMFLLVGLSFNLNLFSRFSDVSATLDPKVRIFLSSAFSLFLPVMSYLFSEAKNASSDAADNGGDLSLQAGMILLWMLLVELLRKKVDEVRMHGYSSSIQRAGRVVWLGSLVFFNIRRAGRKALFGVLWVLCATKVVQRIAFTEIGKRSYAYGKNTRLITSYMSQMLQKNGSKDQQEQHQYCSPSTHIDVDSSVVTDVNHGGGGEAMLKRCKFVVMGEEDLVIQPSPDGYKLKDVSPDDNVATVGKIWCNACSNLDQGPRLKRLCLSFGLFKLLRRRFEHLPPVIDVDAETRECRGLLFNGVYNERTEDAAEALFQMMNDEVNFLCEYYHSVIPVVLASPFFFLANYILLPVVVSGLCIMTIILSSFGNVLFALSSIRADNFAISAGVINTTMCLLIEAFYWPPAFFTAVNFFITFFLLVIFFFEEIWEFIIFLFSDWFMVSLLCHYVTKPQWQSSPMYSGAVRRILWVQSKLSRPILNFKQFSMLNIRWPLVLSMPSMFSLLVQTVPVPKKAKHSIVESLVAHIRDGRETPLNNGKSALVGWPDDLMPACRSNSVAEVILTWHVATSIMEAKCPPQDGRQSKDSHTVATSLSRYCAYLVAFHPTLLPENPDNTERVFEAAKAELKGVLGCASYYLSWWHTRVDKIMQAVVEVATMTEWKDGEVVFNAAKLGILLKEEAMRDNGVGWEQTWKLLADVWTELVVYLAPSNQEERVMGHESVLVQGGEFITMLWALTTHTGITRPEK
ncbi:hypothetical protein CFC21_075246 [Triticum aestivum]|uniref:DUF4220 domain-containing protein n=3 Tax=Triticum TaxID=4564 RepID=A0A9R0XQM4_TRITD|nr:uncharacterized protein LOC123114475 [Triticum aestivum]KAF7069647.1 hypothetical protein CFC21_075246 [Triticum aestivum]VAI40743.1 unnamed protein product [Triticum turgidum subsp. durum]